MRIFTASLATETNTFSPIPTDRASFEMAFYAGPGRHPDTPTLCSAPMVVLRRRPRLEGFSLIEGTAAWAEPGGLLQLEAYEDLRDEILDQLRAALPVDGVILGLHGAMVAQGCDDCEDDLPGKLSLDGGLVDDRPDRGNLGELELIEDVLRKRDYPPVDVQPEELPLWRALEGEAGSDERGRAGQKLNIEVEVGDVLEILDQHVTVAGQRERSAVMLNLIIDVLSELLPIPSIQAVDVGAVEIGKRGRGQNGILLGWSGLPHRDRPSQHVSSPRKRGSSRGIRRS